MNNTSNSRPFTPEQQARLRAGLKVMEDPATPHGTGTLVTVNLAGQVTGLCAAGCLCHANPDLVQLVVFGDDDRNRRSESAGYAMLGQSAGLTRSSSLPLEFAGQLGLNSVDIRFEALSEQAVDLVRRALPSFAPGWPTSLSTLNDSGQLSLPEIASVLREVWTLPAEPHRRPA